MFCQLQNIWMLTCPKKKQFWKSQWMFWQKNFFWVCKSEWVFIQNDKRYLLLINEEIENAWIEYDWVCGATLIYSGKISAASGNMYFMWMEEIQCNLPLWTRLINDIQANQPKCFLRAKAWACLLTEQVFVNTSWVQCYLCWTHWELMCCCVLMHATRQWWAT